MEMIALRSQNGIFPKVHVFSTFFYPKYLTEGYSGILKRWTRRVRMNRSKNNNTIFDLHFQYLSINIY
jgi:Ulp1 family protease